MKKFIIPFLLLLIFSLTACQDTTNQQSLTTEDTITEGNMPFENLVRDDVQEVKMFTEPLQTEVSLSEDQIIQLIEILNKVIIYEQISSQTLVGQMIQYQIVKTDGSTLTLKAITPYIIMDDVWYKAEYEPCEELNQLANKVLKTLN